MRCTISETVKTNTAVCDIIYIEATLSICDCFWRMFMRKKPVQYIFCFFITMCLATVVGCTPKTPETDPTVTDMEIPEEIALSELEQYTIIFGEDSDKESVSAALDLDTYFKKQCGLNISYMTDYLKKGETVPASAKEIVVGVTNRRADQTNQRYSDYRVDYENGRIFFSGGSGSAVKSAVKWFCETCISAEKVDLKQLPHEYQGFYSLEELKICGVALKEFSVEEIDGNDDDDLRNWIGTRAGIRKRSENGYVIRLVADKTFYLNEVSAVLNEKELLLSASAYLEDMGVAAVQYFKDLITTRSGDNIELQGKVVIDLPKPKVPLTDVREASGTTKMVYAETDKDPLSYAVGEEIVFACTLYAGNTVVSCPKFTWECGTEDGKNYSGEADGSYGKLVVKIPATGMGNVRLKVFVKDKSGNLISEVKQSTSYNDVTVFTAVVNAPALTAKAAEPSDFDSFWASEIAKVTAVDPNLISMIKVDNPGSVSNVGNGTAVASNFDFYRVKIQTPDECGYAVGYLSIPKNRPAGSLGITVVFNGYGVSDLSPYASSTDIVLNVCAHSIELGRESSYYSNLSNSGGALYNYCFKNNGSRDTCYFRTMILRDLQAVRFIKAYAGTKGVRIEGSAKQSLGLWNGKLRVYGGSQGAFQGIAVAALDHDVTDAYWWIPWMCDVNGARSEFRPSYTPALRYFDSVFFGKRISKDVNATITMGLGDYICPPSGVIALYNTMNAKVTMTCEQGMTHGYTPQNAAVTTYSKNKS